jgi:uncharacterized membrane-anchored protein YitT (DUF2179 family)
MGNKSVREAVNLFLVVLGILSAGMGIKGYLLSSHFIDGGVTGISMLLNNIFGWPLYVLIPLINLPFVVLGYFQMGQKFAIKSSLAILGLALCLAFVPYPDVTPDKLLTALFGGFFIGLGIGLAIRGGAVLDGTEIAALLASKKSVLKVADVILILNIAIFGTAIFVLGIEPASYSIVTYFAAAKTIDFLLHGLEEYTGVTIVSEKSDEIKTAIVEQLSRGITVYSGKGGHGKRGETTPDNEIVFTVVTRLEVGRLLAIIKGIDADAFIIQQSITDMQGGMIKKMPMH